MKLKKKRKKMKKNIIIVHISSKAVLPFDFII